MRDATDACWHLCAAALLAVWSWMLVVLVAAGVAWLAVLPSTLATVPLGWRVAAWLLTLSGELLVWSAWLMWATPPRGTEDAALDHLALAITHADRAGETWWRWWHERVAERSGGWRVWRNPHHRALDEQWDAARLELAQAMWAGPSRPTRDDHDAHTVCAEDTHDADVAEVEAQVPQLAARRRRMR